jgi:hypothetical protein
MTGSAAFTLTAAARLLWPVLRRAGRVVLAAVARALGAKSSDR